MKIKTHRVDGTTVTRSVSKSGDWSDERIALLRKLWKTSLPSSEIAKEICKLPGPAVTKNACCGKATRLGLANKPNALTSGANQVWLSERSLQAWETRYENGTDKGRAWRK